MLKEIQDLLNTGIKETRFEPKLNIFDTISPLDFRYYARNEAIFQKLQPYLSENAMIKYMAKVESALTKVLAKKNICSQKIADEIEKASKKITAEEVYIEEDKLNTKYINKLLDFKNDKIRKSLIELSKLLKKK